MEERKARRAEAVQMDATALLEGLLPESVDLLLTDPAYESLAPHKERGGTTVRLTRWFEHFTNDKFDKFFVEAHRVLRPGHHAYVFCDRDTLPVAERAAHAAGFVTYNWLVWDKVAIGMGYHYRRRYEFILFLGKKPGRGGTKRPVANLGIGDVLVYKRLRGTPQDGRPVIGVEAKATFYPTEKPVGLMRVLVDQSTLPGELVVDPFCGSGSSGVAAVTTRRLWLGGDVSAEAVELTNWRLSNCR